MSGPEFTEWLSSHAYTLVRVLALLGLGIPLVGLAGRGIRKGVARFSSEQNAMVLQKASTYGLSALLLVLALRELGFNLSALLGAAGIFGVAIGFASQTSLSNFISGLFLVGEKPFQIGDVLQVGDTVGAVHSIGLLSTQLRTFDNKAVRIPNESLIKSPFTNITRYPIRRFDVDVGVAYKEDIRHVLDILKDIADKNPHSLDEPEPVIIFKGFGDSSLNILFGIWFAKADFIKLRNSILCDIKERFDEEGIEIPFPHRTLYAGSVTDAFPITQNASRSKPD
ncbi:MAG: small-conductance mechanosensitive channel [Candidatus Promineifilaceae bacterium]|jgi:small-conductance mechanosensitive channel